MKVDLHTHTIRSDGELSPQALLDTARANGVTHLAITDHDNDFAIREILGNDSAGQVPPTQNVTLISGIEFSTRWRAYDIHVLALNYQIRDAGIQTLVEQQKLARCQRNQRIISRLIKAGIPEAVLTIDVTQNANLGRVHIAEMLVKAGYAKSQQQAFKKFLGRKGQAYVNSDWVPLGEIIQVVSQAAGTVVLAHPLKYDMTRTKIATLCSEFKNLGGHGLEVISGKQEVEQTHFLAGEANKHGLLASLGSDFHRPNQSWAALGCAGELPRNCEPVWRDWPAFEPVGTRRIP